MWYAVIITANNTNISKLVFHIKNTSWSLCRFSPQTNVSLLNNTQSRSSTLICNSQPSFDGHRSWASFDGNIIGSTEYVLRCIVYFQLPTFSCMTINRRPDKLPHDKIPKRVILTQRSVLTAVQCTLLSRRLSHFEHLNLFIARYCFVYLGEVEQRSMA